MTGTATWEPCHLVTGGDPQVMPGLRHLISPYSVRPVELWFAQAQWHT